MTILKLSSGEYYVSDAAGNMVQYKIKVLDISGTNTVTLTALLGSDVILTPKYEPPTKTVINYEVQVSGLKIKSWFSIRSYLFD